MTVGKAFGLRLQYSLSLFVPMEVLHKVITSLEVPDIACVGVIEVKTSSKCSTFISSDLIRRASPDPGLLG